MNQEFIAWLRKEAERRQFKAVSYDGPDATVDRRHHGEGCWHIHDDCALQKAADALALAERDVLAALENGEKALAAGAAKANSELIQERDALLLERQQWRALAERRGGSYSLPAREESPAAAVKSPKTDAPATCELCGLPMPAGEEVFKFHGYSGPCPTPSPAR